MRLQSAFEDFLHSVGTVTGLLAKLDYVSSLRDDTGQYVHWGLAKAYGGQPAQRAMAQAHSLVFLELLRTPLRELEKEASTGEVLLGIQQKGTGVLVPADLKGGSMRHFNSVLRALGSLARAKNRPTA